MNDEELALFLNVTTDQARAIRSTLRAEQLLTYEKMKEVATWVDRGMKGPPPTGVLIDAPRSPTHRPLPPARRVGPRAR